MSDYLARYPFLLYKPEDAAFPVGVAAEGLTISEADTFSPRITSTRGETDLDSTLHHTFPVNNGFNKNFTEDNQNYRVVGNYNAVDGNLYPKLPYTSLSSTSTYLSSDTSWTARATTYNALYIALREGSTNALYKITNAGVASKITLPAAISGSASPITSIVFHKNYLFVAGETASATYFNLHRYNITANTWQDVSGFGVFWFKLRESLYHINKSSNIYLGSNLEAAGSATWTAIKVAGVSDQNTDLPDSALEWNGAAWIGKQSGLYRFDGVDVVQIFDKYPQFLRSHQGALYWVTSGWLYRFNGSLIEKLQYYGASERVIDIEPVASNLYILTSVDVSNYVYGGKDSSVVLHRIFEYDGASFRVFDELQVVVTTLASVKDLILTGYRATTYVAAGFYKHDLESRYKVTTSTSQTAQILTADFDGDLPNIRKQLRRIQVDLDNALAADSITAEFQRYADGVWSAFSAPYTLFPIDSTYAMNIFTFPARGSVTTAHYTVFEKIRIKLTLSPSVGSSVSLKSLTVHYTLHPRTRTKIIATVLVSGDNPLEAKTNFDGSRTSLSANKENYELRQYLLPSVRGGTLLLGLDRAKLHTAVSTTGQMTIRVTPGFYLNFYEATTSRNESPLVALVDSVNSKIEIVRISAVTQYASYTELTVHYRGEYRTVAQTFATATTHVFPVMPIGRQRLVSDQVVTQTKVMEQDENATRQIQRRLTIEMTEL